MQAKDTCILTPACHAQRQKSKLRGGTPGGPAQQHCLALLNSVSPVVPLWEIQRARAEKAQTGQVRGVLRGWGRAGKSPACNMTHTELPSAPSPVC